MFPLVKGGVNTPPAKLACGASATPPLLVIVSPVMERLSMGITGWLIFLQLLILEQVGCI